MIYTDTDICNNALALIGESPIQSVDGTSEKERRCNVLYGVTVREVQNGFVWQELVTTLSLNPVPAEVGTMTRRFDLPPNCLRVMKVMSEFGNASIQAEMEYYIEGNQIVCNANSISVTYLSTSLKPSEWSVELSQCIYYMLAYKLAPMISDNSGLANSIMQAYKQVVEPEARRLQSIANESTSDKKYAKRGSWISKRHNRRNF